MAGLSSAGFGGIAGLGPPTGGRGFMAGLASAGLGGIAGLGPPTGGWGFTAGLASTAFGAAGGNVTGIVGLGAGAAIRVGLVAVVVWSVGPGLVVIGAGAGSTFGVSFLGTRESAY